MITKVYIDNYNSLVNFSVDLDKISVLIGRNGVGKTGVFRVIGALSDFVSRHKSVDEVFSEKTLTKWLHSDIQVFEIYMKVNDHDYLYHLEIEYDLNTMNKRVKKENVQCDRKDIFNCELGHVTLFNDSYLAGAEIALDWNYSGVSMVADRRDNKLLSCFKKEMSRIIVCSPKPYIMSGFVDAEKRLPDYSFSNVGEVLKWLLLEAPEKIVALNEEYRMIFPSFSRVFLSGSGEDKILYFAYKINGEEYSFKASDVSDGERQLYALYLLLIYYFKEGYILFIDEPDNFISIREIQPWCIKMEQILEDEANAGQCVIVSHHGEIIDYLANPSGIWMTRVNNYITKIAEPPVISSNAPVKYSDYIKVSEDEQA